MPEINRTAGLIKDNNIDTLREDLTALKTDFSALMTDLAASGKNVAKRGAEKLSGTAESATEQMTAMCNSARETVGRHPLTSVLIAAGVGAVLARLMAVRSHR